MHIKKIFASAIVLSGSFIFFSTGCVNNKKDVLYACDSTNVSYSKTVQPIIKANCYNCHSNANATNLGGSIVLESYSDINNWIDITPNSDGGTLVNDIKHLGNPMPKNQPKLSDCDITKIANWVKEGGLNN
ncbi:MAG: hypothetical protein ACOVO1_00270 [Chitinophagaceae bacterium]